MKEACKAIERRKKNQLKSFDRICRFTQTANPMTDLNQSIFTAYRMIDITISMACAVKALITVRLQRCEERSPKFIFGYVI